MISARSRQRPPSSPLQRCVTTKRLLSSIRVRVAVYALHLFRREFPTTAEVGYTCSLPGVTIEVEARRPESRERNLYMALYLLWTHYLALSVPSWR